MSKILLYIRAILLPWIFVIHTFYCSILVLTALIVRAPRKFVDWLIAKVWCHAMLIMAGIKVNVSGVENIPENNGFLFLFTHSSHFDIPIMFSHSPKGFRFGAKAELLKIPVFGHAARLAGTLPITRDDRAKVIEVYREAEKRVANGEAFALSPEGGRRKGKDLNKFKSGPFIFAFNAKMPIVPVVLCGVEGVMQKGSILINSNQFIRTVGMKILPAMETKDLTMENVREFRDRVEELMTKEYKQMQETYL